MVLRVRAESVWSNLPDVPPSLGNSRGRDCQWMQSLRGEARYFAQEGEHSWGGRGTEIPKRDRGFEQFTQWDTVNGSDSPKPRVKKFSHIRPQHDRQVGAGKFQDVKLTPERSSMESKAGNEAKEVRLS